MELERAGRRMKTRKKMKTLETAHMLTPRTRCERERASPSQPGCASWAVQEGSSAVSVGEGAKKVERQRHKMFRYSE